MKRIHKKTLGRYAEDIASRFLKRKGVKIIERNFFHRFGEIDIVAKDADEFVFVEVRSGSDCGFADPAESIRNVKIERLRKLALAWLNLHQIQEYNMRFDVVAIVFKKRFKENIIKRFLWRNRYIEIRHIKSAF